MADITITDDGARADVEANTETGEAFVDAWTFGILQVLDSGRIVIVREVEDEFRTLAAQRGVTIEETET